MVKHSEGLRPSGMTKMPLGSKQGLTCRGTGWHKPSAPSSFGGAATRGRLCPGGTSSLPASGCAFNHAEMQGAAPGGVGEHLIYPAPDSKSIKSMFLKGE